MGDILNLCKFYENAFVPLALEISRPQVWHEQGIAEKNVTDIATGYTNFVAMEVK